jgi:hypothetical protein
MKNNKLKIFIRESFNEELEEGKFGKALGGLALGASLAFGSPNQANAQQIRPAETQQSSTVSNLNDINSMVKQINLTKNEEDKVILFTKMIIALQKSQSSVKDRRMLANSLNDVSKVDTIQVIKNGHLFYSLKNLLTSLPTGNQDLDDNGFQKSIPNHSRPTGRT